MERTHAHTCQFLSKFLKEERKLKEQELFECDQLFVTLTYHSPELFQLWHLYVYEDEEEKYRCGDNNARLSLHQRGQYARYSGYH